jgi:ribosome-associated translation inhibitor RaiA
MKASDKRTPMRVIFDAHQCSLAPTQLQKMRDGFDTLVRKVADFPLSDLHVLVERNERRNDYAVKVTLLLDGTTLVDQDHDVAMHAAFERCLRSLMENVRAYKDQLGQVPERHKQQKGTHQGLAPSIDPDPSALEASVAAGDYTAFRLALIGYEEPLRKRVGRWVERYPDLDAHIGGALNIADIVEEVFLCAYEHFSQRPQEVRLGDWLTGWIDPSLKALRERPEEELENINQVRTAVEFDHGPGAV